MHLCDKCGSTMIDAAIYDPDGLIPLHGGHKAEGRWWVCINRGCEDGANNVPASEESIGRS